MFFYLHNGFGVYIKFERERQCTYVQRVLHWSLPGIAVRKREVGEGEGDGAVVNNGDDPLVVPLMSVQGWIPRGQYHAGGTVEILGDKG